MAIGQIFNTLQFGNINSGDYGIYITGEAVYNAPEKAVTIVSVPGRNGDIVIDKGYFKNLEVTYNAGTFGEDQADFRTRLSRWRNAIKSQNGYQRLSDTYHPEQYRMAIFVDAFEVDAKQNVAGEFDLVFNCKPQRWLTSGETPVVVANGDTLTNPTLFDAEPLLAVKGSGLVKFNGYEINVINPYRGDVMLVDPAVYLPDSSQSIFENIQNIFVEDVALSGDTITIGPITVLYSLDRWQLVYGDEAIEVCAPMDEDSTLGGTTKTLSISAATAKVSTVLDSVSFSFADTPQYVTKTHTTRLKTGFMSNGSLVTRDYYVTFEVSYHITNEVLFITLNFYGDSDEVNRVAMSSASTKGVSVYSTVSILGDPTYLDCELGEAYMIEDGEVVSLNQHIDMGSRLPKLVPGDTEFEITGNITEVKVTPRWWEL